MPDSFETKEFKLTPVLTQEMVLRDVINQEKNKLMTSIVENRWYESIIIKEPANKDLIAFVIDKKKKMAQATTKIEFMESWLDAMEKGEEFIIGEVDAGVAEDAAKE